MPLATRPLSLKLLALAATSLLTLNGCGSFFDPGYGMTGPRQPFLNNSDESLSTDEYIQLGMPAISRGWTNGERQDALEVLAILVRDRSGALPRLDSAKSKPLFDKMVGKEGLEAVMDSAAPAQSRLIELQGAAYYEAALLQLYTAAHLRTGMYDDELALLLARSLWVQATDLELRTAAIRDGMPVIFTDPAHELDAYRDMLKRSMLVVPKLLEINVFMGADARLRMVTAAMPSAKKLLTEFDPMTRSEFRASMQRARDGQTDTRLLSAYDQLSALNDSAGPSELDKALAARPHVPRADGLWQRYASKIAGVSAEFPGKPLERTRQGGVNQDLPSVVYSIWTQTDDGVRFTLLRVRGQWNNRSVEDYVRNYNRFLPKRNVTKFRVLDKESQLTSEVEFRFNHVGIARVIASGDDVTQVIVESTGKDINALRKKAKRFFDSLQVEPFDLGEPKKTSPEQMTMLGDGGGIADIGG